MESTENMSVGTETGRLTTQEVVNFNVFKRGNRSPVLQMWSIGNKHSLVVGAGKKKRRKTSRLTSNKRGSLLGNYSDEAQLDSKADLKHATHKNRL